MKKHSLKNDTMILFRVLMFIPLITTIILTACNASPATPAPSPTQTALAELTLAWASDPGASALFDMLNEGVAEKAIDIKIKIVELSFDDAHKQEVEQGKANGSAYDLFMMDDPWVPEYAMNKYIVDLTELGYEPDNGYVKNTLELGYWPPHSGPRFPGIDAKTRSDLYALPVIGDTQLFMYRKDEIAKAPETWDEIRQIAETQTDPSANRYLMAMRGVAGNPVVSEWFPYLYSFGGELFDNQWHPTFNGPEGVAALEEFLGLMKYQPTDVANFDSSQQIACYLEGQCLNNIAWTGSILAAEDPSQSKVVGRSGWATTPQQIRHRSQIGNFMIAIANGSKNKEAALKFMQWLTSDEAQLEFAKRRGIPVRVAVFQDSGLQERYPWLPVVKDALDNSVARPRTPDWAAIESILGQHLHQAVLGEETALGALDLAAMEVTDYLEQKGYYR